MEEKIMLKYVGRFISNNNFVEVDKITAMELINTGNYEPVSLDEKLRLDGLFLTKQNTEEK
jgi:hypothetical protein